MSNRRVARAALWRAEGWNVYSVVAKLSVTVSNSNMGNVLKT
jgi:hypothetical protein